MWRPGVDFLEYFYYEVPPHVAATWRSGTSTQVIGQAELHPILTAKRTWAEALKGQRVIFLVDNDSARDAHIKGYSPSLSSCRILADSAAEDARLGISSWYERVPSYCNIADAPSRRDFRALIAARARSVVPVLPADW